jgi:hypothetical protein
MRIKYKGRFKDDLLDYVNEQPFMFMLDGGVDEESISFWELPLSMQWGVVQDFAETLGSHFSFDKEILTGEYSFAIYYADSGEFSNSYRTSEEARKGCIEKLQKLYNENKIV